MDEHEYQNGATPGPEQTPDHPPPAQPQSDGITGGRPS